MMRNIVPSRLSGLIVIFRRYVPLRMLVYVSKQFNYDSAGLQLFCGPADSMRWHKGQDSLRATVYSYRRSRSGGAQSYVHEHVLLLSCK
jgi:hypothetical protein